MLARGRDPARFQRVDERVGFGRHGRRQTHAILAFQCDADAGGEIPSGVKPGLGDAVERDLLV